jgi:hypothetical protein
MENTVYFQFPTSINNINITRDRENQIINRVYAVNTVNAFGVRCNSSYIIMKNGTRACKNIVREEFTRRTTKKLLN